MPGWWNGIHAEFKPQFLEIAGSSPAPGTKMVP